MNRSSNGNGDPVSSRPIVTQEWSLHAELTFSHDRAGGCTPARQPSNDSGMYTSCSWSSQATPNLSSVTTQPIMHPCYGFQRGNILFTTTPPSRITLQPPSDNQVLSFLQATNNCSEPSSVHRATPGHSPSGHSPQPYNRRCKSTCSIILSGVHDPPSANVLNASCDGSVNRGASCSPTPRCFHTITHRCGDPVCYHAGCPTLGNVFDKTGAHCMTAPESVANESCEVCGGGRSPTALRRASRANTFTTHFCTHVPERAHSFGGTDCKQTSSYMRESKDAAIQTTDLDSIKSSYKKGSKSVKDNNFLLVPEEKGNSPERRKSSKKLSRSPARLRGKSPLIQSRRNSVSDSRASTPEAAAVCHKPRTVHIDVYCTGSEDADASTSDTQEDIDSFSSPQTVFESEKLRVVQKHAGKNDVPLALQPRHLKPDIVIRSESLKSDTLDRIPQHSFRRFDSDDGLSSQYPSKQSSYSTFPDSESSIVSDLQTSRDPSSSTISSSSCAIFNEDYDSVAATSWKDTITEIESLDQSNISLAQSDSFEYADAADRLRIREKEKAWACSDEQTGDVDESSLDPKKSWQSPDTERKRLLQQQKFREYLEKYHGSGFPLWKPNASEDSDEEDDDETGDAWIFSASASGFTSEKVNTVKREGTVKKASAPVVASVLENISPNLTCPGNKTHLTRESGSLSDSGTSTKHRFVRRDVIGPFGVKSPTPPPSKVESIVTTPFTAVGNVTNQRFKAQKFGTIVGAFKKPGHHVGPARNPDCTCEHCREYYETIGRRGRARSVGDMPYATLSNLKT